MTSRRHRLALLCLLGSAVLPASTYLLSLFTLPGWATFLIRVLHLPVALVTARLPNQILDGIRQVLAGPTWQPSSLPSPWLLAHLVTSVPIYLMCAGIFVAVRSLTRGVPRWAAAATWTGATLAILCTLILTGWSIQYPRYHALLVTLFEFSPALSKQVHDIAGPLGAWEARYLARQSFREGRLQFVGFGRSCDSLAGVSGSGRPAESRPGCAVLRRQIVPGKWIELNPWGLSAEYPLSPNAPTGAAEILCVDDGGRVFQFFAVIVRFDEGDCSQVWPSGIWFNQEMFRLVTKGE